MSESKQKSFAETLLKNTGRGLTAQNDDTETASTKERQHAAQAFGLRIKFKDGRRTQGFSWAHYGGSEWADEGDHETITLIFGISVLTVVGFNLSVLIRSIDEGQLKAIRELSSVQADALRNQNPDNEPIIIRVQCDPPFKDIVKAMKGEDEHETGHVGKLQRR